jgi:SAM-dependent methyltransferase
MNDWTSGYVADIGYTYGYYLELNPLRVKLAFLSAGLVAPEFGTACELGFGQGLSANMHAAASICSWHGTDFNPSQAGFAQELASVSGANAHLYDEAFDEFAKRDMPEFDYIGVHGIWSWISDENRAVIVNFIRKKLKVGGVLYISYNTLPGWGTFAPMRHLMTEHAEVIGADGVGIVSRIDGALDFTEKLLATNPLFARANPLINEKINKITGQNRHYLAHEYFNRDWHPMHFATMAVWMESAKLTYACSAHYLDHLDAVNLTAEQQAFLKDIHDPMFKQTVRDFMVNQQFRKDYWVKGARTLTPLEQAEQLREQRFVMSAYRPDVSLKVSGSLGEATLTESIYAPVLDLMSDFKVRTLAQMEQLVKDKGIKSGQLSQAVLVLCGNGTLSAVQDETAISKAKKHTAKLNTHLMLKARSGNDVTYLASPVTGGGVNVGRFHQLFLMALEHSKKKPEEWAGFVAEILAAQGQKIVKEGKPLDTPEEHMAELTTQAHEFSVKQLPIFKALQIA